MLKRIRGILGEEEPFLNCSKASKLRVFDAILRTGSTLYGAWAIGGYDDTYASIIYNVEVDEDKLEQLEKLSKSKLSPHPDIQVGFNIHQSAKAILYD